MQTKAALDKLSRLRAALRDALKELETTLEVAYERSALVKGNVYELAANAASRLALAPKGGCTAAWFSVGVIRARRV